MKEENECDFWYKILLIGDSFVGKSNIFYKNINNDFVKNSKPTVGAEFVKKIINKKGYSIKLQIWDILVQDRYPSITSAYHKGAPGIFIIFDVTKKESCDNIRKWINQINKLNVPLLILLGNKADCLDE